MARRTRPCVHCPTPGVTAERARVTIPALLLPYLQHGQERLLRHLDPAHLLHALLARLLLLEQLALPRDVAAVALRDHALAHRLPPLPRDDLRSDRRLDRPLELLARDPSARPPRAR